MKLVLLSQDLMIGARVEGAARQHELTTMTLGNASAAVDAACRDDCRLLLVDLRLPGLNVVDLVTAIRSSEASHTPIVACGPHVHESKLTEARNAGCDEVVTRGQLDREAEEIFGRLLGE